MQTRDPESEARSAGVVVVGGGFGGLYTVQALARERRHPSLLLIEPRERFVFLPLLYELLSGEMRSWEIAPRYDKVLAGLGVGWLQDRVERIDLDAHLLHTAAGRTLGFERLVLATGASTDTFGVPGADRHCLGFRSLEDVRRLQQLLGQLSLRSRPLQRLAVVGAGPTGVELACKLADLVGETAVVELIEQGERLLPLSKAFNREQATLSLQRRDVRVRTRTRVVEVGADRLRLRLLPGGEEEWIAVQGVIWTAGQRCRPPLITPAPRSDGTGRLLCDQELRLQGREDVFVVGDLGAVPESPDAQELSLPTTAQVAFQQAPVVAANLLASLEAREARPFHWSDLGEMISLGRGEASLTSGGITLAGPTAFQLRRLAYLTRLPGLPQQLRAAAGWLSDWGA
jgi:NADH:ubiquinone reductase (non-electrogenic)